MKRLERFASAVDRASVRVGESAAWLYPVLVVVLIVNVLLRYGFSLGLIELEELQWHLYAAAFLLGLAYTHVSDKHVRVDLVRGRLAPRTRAWIELLGSLLLLSPFALLLTYYSVDFVALSWATSERSAMPSGLPARYVIKGVMVIALGLLGLQALATAARALRALRWPETE